MSENKETVNPDFNATDSMKVEKIPGDLVSVDDVEKAFMAAIKKAFTYFCNDVKQEMNSFLLKANKEPICDKDMEEILLSLKEEQVSLSLEMMQDELECLKAEK